MKLIKLDASYAERYKKIIDLSFPPENEIERIWTDIFLKHKDIWDDTFGYVEEDTLASVFSSYSGKMHIRNSDFQVKYIENVATLPPYRGKGLIKGFFAQEFQKDFDSPFTFLCLGPFKHQFYRRLGFENGMDSNRLEMDFDFISPSIITNNKYTVKMGYLHKNPDFQNSIKQIQGWFKQHNRYNEIQDPQIFVDTFFSHSKYLVAIVYNENKSPVGHCVYYEKDQLLKIYSFQYINLTAFYSLKKYLLSYRDQATKLQFNSIPPDFPIDLLIDNYWISGKKFVLTANPWQMIRIVNILSLFNQLQLSFPKQDIYMEIKDKQIEQNNGVFCLSSDYPIKKIDNLLKPIDVSMSISDLVPLITGRKSALDLYFMGKLRVIQTQSNSGSNQSEKIINSLDKIPSIVHEIDKIFPKQITYSG